MLKTGEQREMYDLGQESMLWYEEDGEHKDVHFEWYGDYMVVWSYNNGDGEKSGDDKKPGYDEVGNISRMVI